MKSPSFLLHGIRGVYNYGCEAIIRGTVGILRQGWPSCEIRYASYRPREDRIALADCAIEIVDQNLSLRLLRRLAGGSLRRLHIPYIWAYRESLKWAREGDCVISIGGDIFTLPTKPYPAKPVFTHVDFAHQVMGRGKKFVLWGASVGPFEDWPLAVPIFKRALQEITFITARESVTVDYLKTLGVVNNVVRVADPAFLMSDEKCEIKFPFPKGRKPVLGVNLSPLSIRHVFDQNNINEVIKMQVETLQKLITKLDVNLILVPHVICPWSKIDDDYGYLFTIYEQLNRNHQGRVAILPSSLGAIKTKGLISSCDALIAARMHCAIAGVSMGVPTLFLSYSNKAKGMANYVYGNTEWVISVQDFVSEDIIQKVGTLIENRQMIRKKLVNSSSSFKKEALRAGDILKEFL